MLLSQKELNQKLKANQLRLAFIGMSNIGKSMRSLQLEQNKNFSRYSVDNGIIKKLNLKTEQELGRWLGFPYEPQFQANQKKYLELEEELTLKAANNKTQNNFILDTTGSVIYLSQRTLEQLKNNFLIIHFQVPKNIIQKKLAKYCQEPTSLIWGDLFEKEKLKQETNQEALKRLYPVLLAEREKKYRQLADISIDFFRDEALSLDDFWKVLIKYLPNM